MVRALVENAFDPRQARDARGRWTTSGASKASRLAYAHTIKTREHPTRAAHEEATRAHNDAAGAHDELAARHAKIGNVAAAKRAHAQATEHKEYSGGHVTEAAKLGGPAPRVRRFKSEARIEGARRGHEKRRENEDCVRGNIPPDTWSLWERVKRGPGLAKGTCETRTTRFLEYVEENEPEVITSLEEDSDAKLAKLIREQEDADRELQRELDEEREAMQANPPKESSRFSREKFGGGEAGEAGAHAALLAHEATLTPGTTIRVYRGQQEGVTAVVTGPGPGRTVRAVDADGHGWTFETRNVEVVKRNPAKRAPASAYEVIKARAYARTTLAELVNNAAAGLAKVAEEMKAGASPKSVRSRIAADVAVLQAVLLEIEGKGPATVAARANPSPPSFKAAHWGVDAKGSRAMSVPDPKDNDAAGGLTGMGTLVQVRYQTHKGQTKVLDTFFHDFKGTKPLLAYGKKDGRLYIVGGSYKVTSRGIVG